ncbi:MAG TPA: hypothetical protein VK348_04905 [Planctomycetota bacterium]|nr:hypothetical protein [Planctomycetota bacterium]
MRLDHPIFHTPLAVDVVLDQDHPYTDAHDGQGTWLVHEGEFGKGCDVGIVSDGHGFEDSPDCERISGGINSKGPRAVAIGRQANLLQWGFYGAPDRMTAQAKRAFLNAIVYMRKFDGQAPLVQKQSRGRTWLSQFADTLAHMSAEERKGKGENNYASYLKKNFPAELVGDDFDPAKLRAWYENHEEYFGHGKERHDIVLDEDLVALHLSNRKPAFLDWLRQRFAKDPHDTLALRLAARYLGPEHGKDAATALAFLDDNRPFLFFSDTGGYRWFVDTNAQRAARAADSGASKNNR